MKSKLGLLLFLFLIVLLGGCSLKEISTDNWRNEVMVAQECGMDGLMCCPDIDPACQYGQECCVDPNDNENNYCADSCDYGKLNTFCRTDEPQCDDSLACSDSKCVTCGGKDQPCCQENACQGELVCYQEKCYQCGESGSPCCQTGAGLACNNMDKQDNARNECYNGICIFCGANGGAACQSQPACNGYHLLNNGFCLRCGGYNQPCCEKSQGADHDCDPKEELTCLLGFCSKAK